MKFHIGPSTIILLLLTLGFGGYLAYQKLHPKTTTPIIERQVQGGSVGGIAPVPEFLLRHRQELALTAAQAARVTSIAAAYRRDIAPLQEKLTNAATQYSAYVEKHQQTSNNVAELNRHAEELQRLSRVKTATRHSYWQQACATLTRQQQTIADRLVSSATLRDLQ